MRVLAIAALMAFGTTSAMAAGVGILAPGKAGPKNEGIPGYNDTLPKDEQGEAGYWRGASGDAPGMQFNIGQPSTASTNAPGRAKKN